MSYTYILPGTEILRSHKLLIFAFTLKIKMEIACNKKKCADADFYIHYTLLYLGAYIYIKRGSCIDLRYSSSLSEKYEAITIAVVQYLVR